MTAKSSVIKGYGCRSGGCAEKVVELTPGGSALCLGNETEGAVRRPDRNAELSRGRSSCPMSSKRRSRQAADVGSEGPNGARKGLMERQVGRKFHGRQATEKPERAGLKGESRK
jgi:hypothetical protein